MPISVKPSARVKKASNATVRAQADFRNQTFLNTFISELGKLPPKRTTRLQQKTHRHLCRQIKVHRPRSLRVAEPPCSIVLGRTRPGHGACRAYGSSYGTEAESLSCTNCPARSGLCQVPLKEPI